MSKTTNPTPEGPARHSLDPAIEERGAQLIVGYRADALTWKQIAAQLNCGNVDGTPKLREPIPGPKGDRVGPQVYALAKRRQLAVFGPNRDQVKD